MKEGVKVMNSDLCGVCNKEIPIHHACIIRQEGDSYTFYHVKCEGKIPKKPCEDCGKHRLFCSECRE